MEEKNEIMDLNDDEMTVYDLEPEEESEGNGNTLAAVLIGGAIGVIGTKLVGFGIRKGKEAWANHKAKKAAKEESEDQVVDAEIVDEDESEE